ncbi:tyrosine-protein phosphatase [Donghicola mangrovi]|uniref:Dual specificity protein phosphatase family protein n=1 Tax=Donghicola mangrovi TaxID=2729614 RepID=A0A850QAC8_9RHOB|nr:tyrosine-protein phosphatase [Donghicola mangrovi]NVO23898.1 dual specificity protein phosphatase family protein [Donghicola mangrovi]
MLKKIKDWIFDLEVQFRNSFGDDISTPSKRFMAHLHFQFIDHMFLRYLWTNEEEIAPGVWRSNQPDPYRLRKFKKRGINTVLNLRGVDTYAHYLFEKEATDALGMTLIDRKLYARKAPRPERIMEVLETFDTIQKPFVMHCKSGADRAGFASALYLLDQENVPVSEAKKQLCWKHFHQRYTQTGILDHVLDAYEDRINAKGHIPFREWVQTEYDYKGLQKKFKATPMFQR